jgi:hypothetical protein
MVASSIIIDRIEELAKAKLDFIRSSTILQIAHWEHVLCPTSFPNQEAPTTYFLIYSPHFRVFVYAYLPIWTHVRQNSDSPAVLHAITDRARRRMLEIRDHASRRFSCFFHFFVALLLLLLSLLIVVRRADQSSTLFSPPLILL